MIKITRATQLDGKLIRLEFSDGSTGEYDFTPVLEKETELTLPLSDDGEFARFFLDLGALCWPNGLEFSPHSLHADLKTQGRLKHSEFA